MNEEMQHLLVLATNFILAVSDESALAQGKLLPQILNAISNAGYDLDFLDFCKKA